MLRLMLAHHPKLSWLPESEFLVDFVPPHRGWPDVNQYCRQTQLDRNFRDTVSKWDLVIDRELTYPALADSLLEQVRQREHTFKVGATIHRYFDRLMRLWPDAKLVHLVRDGRDVARSRIGMGWSGNIWTAAHDWVEKERLCDEIRQDLPAKQMLDVRYEDLVSEPERILSDICRFLGVAYDPKMMSYPDTSTYSAPDSTRVFQWRRKLSKKEIVKAESVQADMLVSRGYKLSGLPRLRVGQIRSWQLRIQCRVSRSLFRFHRLGARLFLADSLSRRLGLASWRSDVIRRLHANERKFIK